MFNALKLTDSDAEGVPSVVLKLVRLPVVAILAGIKLNVILLAVLVILVNSRFISVPVQVRGVYDPVVNAVVGGVVPTPVGGTK